MTQTEFAKTTKTYTPEEHIDCAREIAEALLETSPCGDRERAIAILRHLEAASRGSSLAKIGNLKNPS